MASVTKGRDKGVQILIFRDTAVTVGVIVAGFDHLNLAQIPVGDFFCQLVDHLFILLQGIHLVLNIFLYIEELI